jgi:hypothetical protein
MANMCVYGGKAHLPRCIREIYALDAIAAHQTFDIVLLAVRIWHTPEM